MRTIDLAVSPESVGNVMAVMESDREMVVETLREEFENEPGFENMSERAYEFIAMQMRDEARALSESMTLKLILSGITNPGDEFTIPRRWTAGHVEIDLAEDTESAIVRRK